MKKILLILTVLLSVSLLYAGRYAGDFMEIGFGIQPLAMGGAFTAVADNNATIYWNASGLGKLKKPELSAMRAFMYNGLAAYDNLAYSQPLPNGVNIAVGWTRLTISNIPHFSEKHLAGTNIDERISFPDMHLPGTPDSKFTATDDLFQFAFSKHIHSEADLGWLFFAVPFDVYFGANIKYIKRKLFENFASGTGFDFSFLFETDLPLIIEQDWAGKFSFGLNFQDVGGTTITWDTESNHEDEVLFNTKMGFAYTQPVSSLNSEVLLSYDKDYVYGKTNHYGLRWRWLKGVDFMLGTSKNPNKSSYSAGVSVKIYNIHFDYAFLRFNEFEENTNRIGIRLNF